ncbi:MAG: PDZ domain-containing protein [bacterium]|nr:PDZ domain-containing protein [bacterium]
MRSGSHPGYRCYWPLLIAGVCVAPAAPTAGQISRKPIEIHDLRDLEATFTRLAQRVQPSTVAIRTYLHGSFTGPDSRRSGRRRIGWLRSYGTGAILEHDGRILTNAHVIEGADEIVVTLPDGRNLEARVVQADHRSDLAVIAVEASNLQTVRLGDLVRVKPGQWCFVAGNPFGLASSDGQASMTYGIVEALGRDLSQALNAEDLTLAEARDYSNLIQTSAAINPGNSGGPLFNINGEMIGVVTAIESRSGVNEGTGFAIPISRWKRPIIASLSRGEAVRYGYLGVQIGPPGGGRRGGGQGAEIQGLDPPDGPAAQARLAREDIIVEFAGITVQGTNHLIRLVGATPAGQAVKITFLRDGRRRITEVTLAERPVSQVAFGGDAGRQEPPTCHWRGAWLAEPSNAILQDAGLSRERSGLVVTHLDPDSETARAGLARQQVVLKLNRRRVRTIDEFLSAAEKADQAATAIRLEVWSEGDTKTIRLPKPGDDTANDGD